MSDYYTEEAEYFRQKIEFEKAFEDTYGVTFDRIRELADAERDGRVVVLPKAGDKLFYAPYPKGARDCRGELFFLRNCGDGSGIVKSVSVTVKFDNWSSGVSIKKTWKTLEEAERALAEKGEATT